MVVQGEDRLKGHDAAAILEEIAARHASPRRGPRVGATATGPHRHRRGRGDTGIVASRRDGGQLGPPDAAAHRRGQAVRARDGAATLAARSRTRRSPTDRNRASFGPADVHVVRYVPEEGVSIEAGENAGQTLTYRNIVTDWQTIGQWDGRSAAEFVFPGAGDGPLAVIVQRAHGPDPRGRELP